MISSKILRAIMLTVLSVLQVGAFLQASLGPSRREQSRVPKLIRQGPVQSIQETTGDPFWYQTGAMGDVQSYNYDGANVTITTVYDKVNNDAHSYWVGGFLSNNAFIQVGYVNEISTTNQPFCCAWFFEYFPDPNNSCCPPTIGPEKSAGPIGSWHNYSMIHTGGGVWSFYMDNKLLGSTPPLGVSNSGAHAPAGIAEVADASSNTDILGPAEFKDLSYHTTLGWQSVPAAGSFIWYGRCPPSVNCSNPPPNPYGVREIEGVKNDFLVGSQIPPLNNPSSSPGSSLWTQGASPPPNMITFTFLDSDGNRFEPSWISLKSSSTSRPIFYTTYDSQKIDSDSWVFDKALWHTVNVAPSGLSFSSPTTTSFTVSAQVFSIRLHVAGAIFGLPVKGATSITFFPDTLNVTASTDEAGNTVLSQFPTGSYDIRIHVPYGIATTIRQNVQGPTKLTARVFGLADMLLIIIAPISAAVLIVIIAIWRERMRSRALATTPPSLTITGNCASCGQPLHPDDQFCQNCGKPTTSSLS